MAQVVQQPRLLVSRGALLHNVYDRFRHEAFAAGEAQDRPDQHGASDSNGGVRDQSPAARLAHRLIMQDALERRIASRSSECLRSRLGHVSAGAFTLLDMFGFGRLSRRFACGLVPGDQALFVRIDNEGALADSIAVVGHRPHPGRIGIWEIIAVMRDTAFVTRQGA